MGRPLQQVGNLLTIYVFSGMMSRSNAFSNGLALQSRSPSGFRSPSLFNKGKNANGFILGMVNKTFFCKRGNNDRRNPCARSPFLIYNRWRHMIPEATVFIIGNDNHHIFSIRDHSVHH